VRKEGRETLVTCEQGRRLVAVDASRRVRAASGAASGGVEGEGDQKAGRTCGTDLREQTCICQVPVPGPARQRQWAVDDRQRKRGGSVRLGKAFKARWGDSYPHLYMIYM
jgi:hypothetical protein